ncbi:MAG: MetS family NSS transporter small subunit [Deltaproteobacteria bacterium]|nr:MAG: MetS family NSS transporter small subunit [Deltaproteobacteria bacterium]
MPVSAIIMLIIGCVVLYGGLAYCISRAIRKKEKEDTTTKTE